MDKGATRACSFLSQNSAEVTLGFDQLLMHLSSINPVRQFVEFQLSVLQQNRELTEEEKKTTNGLERFLLLFCIAESKKKKPLHFRQTQEDYYQA